MSSPATHAFGLLTSVAALVLLAACATTPTGPTATTAPEPAPTAVPAPTSAPAPASTAAPLATAGPVAIIPPSGPALPLVLGVIGDIGAIPYQWGVESGFWEKQQGVRLQIVIHRGGAEAAQALVGGGVDIAGIDFSHIIRLNEGGQAVRAIAPGFHQFMYTLMGPKGASSDLRALKGKKIGISSPGTASDNAMRWLLKTQASLDPEKDVELMAIGSGGSMLAALRSKKVDVAMVTEPYTSMLLVDDYQVIYDYPNKAGLYYNSVYSARQQWLKDNGEAAKRFVKGNIDLLKLLDTDHTARAAARKASIPNVDDKVAELALGHILASLSYKDQSVKKEGVEAPLQWDRAARDLTTPMPNWEPYVDTSFLPAAS